MARERDGEPVHQITGAPMARSDDLNARMRRYLISMAIRTTCVILVVVIQSPVRWGFAVGAIVLPYVAVVMANAAGSRRVQPAEPPPRKPNEALPSARRPLP